MNDKEKILKAIDIFHKQIAGFLKKMSAEDIDLLLSGEKTLSFTVSEKGVRDSKKAIPNFEDVEEIVGKLKEFKTKEEGFRYLEANAKKRLKLEAILRYLDSHYLKSDKIDRLKEKIIDDTIGYRLRSETVSGKRK